MPYSLIKNLNLCRADELENSFCYAFILTTVKTRQLFSHQVTSVFLFYGNEASDVLIMKH
jgi:hypothetical protein